jgi:lipoate synthase
MIEKQQAEELKKAGLTAYNHNLDTSREYYPNIITTRSYDGRLQTLHHVREAGISICSGDYRKSLVFLGFFMWAVLKNKCSSSMQKPGIYMSST